MVDLGAIHSAASGRVKTVALGQLVLERYFFMKTRFTDRVKTSPEFCFSGPAALIVIDPTVPRNDRHAGIEIWKTIESPRCPHCRTSCGIQTEEVDTRLPVQRHVGAYV